MIKNIIFDFGNVVIRFDPIYMTEKYTDTDEETQILSSAVFNPVLFEETDKGNISYCEHLKQICSSLPSMYHKKAELILSNWIYNLPITDGMEEILRGLKNAGYKIYILSNINSQFRDNIQNIPVLKMFDGVLLSSQVGLIKPQPEIYNAICDKYLLKKSETVFIDDRQINVDGAERAGIRGHLFTDSSELRNYINSSDDFKVKI